MPRQKNTLVLKSGGVKTSGRGNDHCTMSSSSEESDEVDQEAATVGHTSCPGAETSQHAEIPHQQGDGPRGAADERDDTEASPHKDSNKESQETRNSSSDAETSVSSHKESEETSSPPDNIIEEVCLK